jgi:hypothetical protein
VTHAAHLLAIDGITDLFVVMSIAQRVSMLNDQNLPYGGKGSLGSGCQCGVQPFCDSALRDDGWHVRAFETLARHLSLQSLIHLPMHILNRQTPVAPQVAVGRRHFLTHAISGRHLRALLPPTDAAAVSRFGAGRLRNVV